MSKLKSSHTLVKILGIVAIFLLISVLALIYVYWYKAPEISGYAAITIDVDTNKVIYSKNIHKKMYPASTTKLMTAILLAESSKPDSIFSYSNQAKQQAQPRVDLPVGKLMNGTSAMDAMLLYSANDIAYMIGENVGGNVDNFVRMMNKKVKELGLQDTHFTSPNGLHNENHYTSAYDLSIIAKQLYNYSWIMDTMHKRTSTLYAFGQTGFAANTGSGSTTTPSIAFPVENKNILLDKDGCIGGKTGSTAQAGKCLVAFYERNGRRVIGVVMKSESSETVFSDMEKIIDWSYHR